MGSLGDIAMGRRTPDPSLRSIFAPPSEPVRFGDLMSTFKGFGSRGVGREGFLDTMEKLRVISPDQRAAGSAGALDGAVRTGAPASFGSGIAGGGAGAAQAAADGSGDVLRGVGAVDNPVYAGAWANAMRDRGFPMPTYAPQGAMTSAAAAAPVETAVREAMEEAPAAAVAAETAVDHLAAFDRQAASTFARLTALNELIARAPMPVAPTVAEKLAPVAAAEVAPVADDLLRTGVKGAMSFEAGITDVLQLLSKFHVR